MDSLCCDGRLPFCFVGCTERTGLSLKALVMWSRRGEDDTTTHHHCCFHGWDCHDCRCVRSTHGLLWCWFPHDQYHHHHHYRCCYLQFDSPSLSSLSLLLSVLLFCIRSTWVSPQRGPLRSHLPQTSMMILNDHHPRAWSKGRRRGHCYNTERSMLSCEYRYWIQTNETRRDKTRRDNPQFVLVRTDQSRNRRSCPTSVTTPSCSQRNIATTTPIVISHLLGNGTDREVSVSFMTETSPPPSS